MANGRIFIDANVWMYAVGVPHPLKEPCANILRVIARDEFPSVTSVEVLQEVLHLYTRRGRREDAILMTRELSRLVGEVLPVVQADLNLALILHATSAHIAARDSLHAATMLNNGIERILSVDPHFDEIDGIERLSPLEWIDTL
ncbi:MAG: type II toxin-antitoxin system VapC family toxin [Caldilineaceae bacterium]|nr:type II toxin-antitoxin system VapC family toxin [Caldilineaceae bacterium]